MFLLAPKGDAASTSGVTLGGSEIRDDASWDGRWTDLAVPAAGHFTLELPAAAAAVVRLQR